MPSNTPRPLRPKQQQFALEYLRDLNATQAAIRAGYSAKTAGLIGYELLKKPHIQAAIDQARQNALQRIRVTADTVLFETARIAFSDIRKLFETDDRLKPMADWDDDSAAAVAGIETEEVYGRGGVKTAQVRKVKLWPKLPAVRLLGQHLGVYERGGLSGQDVEFLTNVVALVLRHVPAEDAKREILTYVEGYLSGAGHTGRPGALRAGTGAA